MAESGIKTTRLFDIKGLDTFDNVLAQKDGALIYANNVESYPVGGKSKRPGYVTFLGTLGTADVTGLFSWTKNNSNLFVYAKCGNKLFYSTNGTGAWTACGNGTVGTASNIGHAVLNDTLTICDGVGSTRYTTNGTSFTNAILAPVAVDVEMFQNRIYAAGTSSVLFYSSAGDATNWITSGTSDSSSLDIPGEGKLFKLFSSSDRLISTKTSGLLYKWDGYSLVDMTTNLGPSSFKSVAQQEGFFFWMNDLGLFGYGGVRPTLISNPIQPTIYNSTNVGIAGSQLPLIPATCHRYAYYAAIGTVTDDITGYTVNNAIMRYDYQKNEFLFWSFANNPTALHSFKDKDGNKQLIFGSSGGQCYRVTGSANTDNGTPIVSEMEYVFSSGNAEDSKKWRWLHSYFNPGCQAKLSVAFEDTFVKGSKKWQELGDATQGVFEIRMPVNSRSHFMYLRVYESSSNPRWTNYGYTVHAEMIPK